MSADLLIVESKGPGEWPIPAGQERLARQSELDAVSDFLQVISKPATVADDAKEAKPASDILITEFSGPVGNGLGINRFLLCAIVGNVARGIKSRGEAGGGKMSLQRIAREVLHSYLRTEASSWKYLLDDEPLADEIKRRLQEVAEQSGANHADDRITAGVE